MTTYDILYSLSRVKLDRVKVEAENVEDACYEAYESDKFDRSAVDDFYILEIFEYGDRTIEHDVPDDFRSPAFSEDLLLAARALLDEIDRQRGLKVDQNGILDPLHPICVQADALRSLLGAKGR